MVFLSCGLMGRISVRMSCMIPVRLYKYLESSHKWFRDIRVCPNGNEGMLTYINGTYDYEALQYDAYGTVIHRIPQYLVPWKCSDHTSELPDSASSKPPKFRTKLCAFCEKFFRNFFEKILAIPGTFLYNCYCCDIDSCEAWGCCLRMAGFPWSECQVMKLATSHCTK